MKQNLSTKAILTVMVMAALNAPAQWPVITSFSQDGLLVCTNLAPGSLAALEWATTVSGPWTNNWAGLDAVTVPSNGTLSVSVPVFYRVRGSVVTPPNMALIPAGSFTMGNTWSGEGNGDELPLHTVQVSSFYMDKYEVTRALWDEVFQWATNHGYSFANAGMGKATNHPVYNINWYDVVKWCNARSQKEGLTPCYYTTAAQTQLYQTGSLNLTNACVKWSANGYRLPTEAEWERAARGGTNGQRFPWGNIIMHGLANYYSSSSYAFDVSLTRSYHPAFSTVAAPYTNPVDYFAPNEYGLCDMAGNLWERCWDCYDANWYASALATETDTRGPAGPLSSRVLRGGVWADYAIYARCAARGSLSPVGANTNIGFRCVRGLG